MVKCSGCGEKLKELRAYSKEENRQTITLDEKGELDWSLVETIEGSCTSIDIECLNCGKTLYHNDGSSTDPKIKALLL